MVVKPETQKSFERAKMMVLTHEVNAIFISSILFSLRFRWTDEVATAATNGTNLLINPTFWESLQPKEHVFLLLHEAYHVALEHVCRIKERDPTLWNMAGDYRINYMLVQQRLKMPLGGLYDHRYDDNWTTDQIYDDLLEDPPPQASSFVLDLQAPEDGGEDGEEGAAEEAIKDIIVKAATRAKLGGEDYGNLPSEIRRWIDELLNPKLPWNLIMQQWMYALVPDDYTMRRPNRRFMPDFYLPSLNSEGLDHIAVCIDVSGSVTDDQMKAFVTELYVIASQLMPKKITLFTWDTELHNIQTITDKQGVEDYEFQGGGGTDVKPVMEYLEKVQPDAAVVFTDGYFAKNYADPKCPIVWAIHSNQHGFEPDFGKVIDYPI